MKELSIEEKAKAYDIALAKIKMLLGTGSNCSREELEYVFPELKESKDERIRNLIYCLIRDRSDSKKLLEHNGVSVDEALAWLEKQAEQKPAWSEEDKNMLEWVIAYFNNRMLNTPISEERTACKNAIAWLFEKQVQKPVEWSEEDDKMCKAVIDNIKAICKEGYFVGDIGSDKLINWLKYLRSKNRYVYNPYKAVVESIAEMCKHYDKASHSGLRDFYDNIKVKCKDAKEYDSLYSQSHWKPSEQDILLLERIFDGKLDPRGFQASLLNIIEQLKKLREE